MLRSICLISLTLIACNPLRRAANNAEKPCPAKPASEASSPAAGSSPLSLHTTLTKITWPLDEKTGKYPIRVCWNDIDLGDRVFLAKEFAPNISELMPVRRQWVQSIVEQEWNGRTNLYFYGWKACKDDPNADIILQPMSSRVEPKNCGGRGQACVNTIGKNNGSPLTKMVYLNVLFGDEFLYDSLYSQSSVQTKDWDPKKTMGGWWTPSACFRELHFAWSTVNANALPEYRIDINNAVNRTFFGMIFKSCLQSNAMHEFGHIAGFLHEQLRKDNSATETEYQACLAYIAENNIGPGQEQEREATPLGMLLSPFDKESIMSYCRETDQPTLTDLDVKGTFVAYPGTKERSVDPSADSNSVLSGAGTGCR